MVLIYQESTMDSQMSVNELENIPTESQTTTGKAILL